MDENKKEPTTTDDSQELHSESDSIDWKAQSRKWESLAKKNSEAAKKLQEIEEANKSEVQKALERAEAAEAKVKELESSAKTATIKQKLSEEFGVPQDFIMGADEEEMRAYAQKLTDFMKPESAAKVPKNGKFDKLSGKEDSEMRDFANEIFKTLE